MRLSSGFLLPTLPQDTFGSAMVISQVSGCSKQFFFCHNQHLEITLIKLLCFSFSVVIFESLKCSNNYQFKINNIAILKQIMLKEILYIIFCNVKEIKYS